MLSIMGYHERDIMTRETIRIGLVGGPCSGRRITVREDQDVVDVPWSPCACIPRIEHEDYRHIPVWKSCRYGIDHEGLKGYSE